RPPGPRCDRSPPRRPEEMSSVDVRLFWSASPERARSLLTVRAAISFAVSSSRPRSSRPSLTCSYWRSRLSFHACCGIVGSSPRGLGGYPGRSSACVVVPPRRVGLLLVAGPDFETQIKQLQATMHTIEQVLDIDAMQREIADLGEQVAAPALWGDP